MINLAPLVAMGFELIIGLIVGAVLFTVGLFIRKITIFDSIALGIIAGLLAHGVLALHPALAVLIGIAVAGLLIWLQSTGPGFWIIGIIMSVVWGFIFAFIAWSVADKNPYWTYGAWVGGAVIIMGLHLWARE